MEESWGVHMVSCIGEQGTHARGGNGGVVVGSARDVVVEGVVKRGESFLAVEEVGHAVQDVDCLGYAAGNIWIGRAEVDVATGDARGMVTRMERVGKSYEVVVGRVVDAEEETLEEGNGGFVHRDVEGNDGL